MNKLQFSNFTSNKANNAFFYLAGLAFLFFSVIGVILNIDVTANAFTLSDLPYLTILTITRIIISLAISSILGLWIGIKMRRNKTFAENYLIPALDILQSIPLLAYITIITGVLIFLFGNNAFVYNCAVIFGLMGAQIWNIVLCVYQYYECIPSELITMSKIQGLNGYEKLLHLYLPYLSKPMIFNIMLSYSASWASVVIAENIFIQTKSGSILEIELAGLGSFTSYALNNGIIFNLMVSASLVLFLILATYHLIFKHLLDYRLGSTGKYLINLFYLASTSVYMQPFIKLANIIHNINKLNSLIKKYYILLLFPGLVWAVYTVIKTLIATSFAQITNLLFLGGLTALRVMISVCISTILSAILIIGLYFNQNLIPYVTPILNIGSALPTNIYYGLAFCLYVNNVPLELIVQLLILSGTTWYMIYALIASLDYIKPEMIDLCQALRLDKFFVIRHIFLTYLKPNLVTGAIVTSGAAWSITVICEFFYWYNQKLAVPGIGSYLSACYRNTPEHAFIALIVLAFYIVIVEKLLIKMIELLSKSIARYNII